jgi:uncharacterized DUF497 family protein
MTKRKKLKGTGKDRATIGGSIGSFLFPLGGGIAYFRIKDEYPKAGKAYGILALISIALVIFWNIFYASTGKTLGKVPKKKLKALPIDDDFWANYAFRKDIVFSDDINANDLYNFGIDIEMLQSIWNDTKITKVPIFYKKSPDKVLLVIGYDEVGEFFGIVLDYNQKRDTIEVIDFFFPTDDELERYYYSRLPQP